jgi:hypothetical protein
MSRRPPTPVRRKLLELIEAEPEGLWTNRALASMIYGAAEPTQPMLVVLRKATIRAVREGRLVQGDPPPPAACESCGTVMRDRGRSHTRPLRPA